MNYNMTVVAKDRVGYNAYFQTYGEIIMGISEVVSPVTRKSSKVASGQPMSPGARSAPCRGDQAAPELQRRDRVAAHQEPPIPSSTPVTIGPEE